MGFDCVGTVITSFVVLTTVLVDWQLPWYIYLCMSLQYHHAWLIFSILNAFHFIYCTDWCYWIHNACWWREAGRDRGKHSATIQTSDKSRRREQVLRSLSTLKKWATEMASHKNRSLDVLLMGNNMVQTRFFSSLLVGAIFVHPFPVHVNVTEKRLVDRLLIPSHVSGRGYRIGPVCLCVCVFVCQRSPGWTVWRTDLKFGGGVDRDNISDEFEGQGHRSKVKVARLKNVIFGCSYGVTCVYCTEPFCYDIRCHVTSRRDVMWRHGVTSWHHLTTFGQEYWQRGHIAGGRVNAQAFSLYHGISSQK